MMDETACIRRAMEGDDRAFHALFESYKEYSYKISYFILNDRDDSLDCVNSSWIRIHAALLKKNFSFKSKFSTWIYTIITNEAILARKQAGRTLSLDDPFLRDSLSALSPDGLTMEEKTAKKLRIERVMERLTPTQRQIVSLLLEGYRFQEIAEKLGINRNYLYQLNSRIKETFEN
jgi:RNA polymerase sigma-70 factor (ECF subfamily)